MAGFLALLAMAYVVVELARAYWGEIDESPEAPEARSKRFSGMSDANGLPTPLKRRSVAQDSNLGLSGGEE